MDNNSVNAEKLGLEPYNPSTISANFLANFMREREYLENTIKNMAFIPRYYAEHTGYLNIKSDNTIIERVIIPMTCFCDIKLHQISHHIEGNSSYEGYGRFAIILKKSWGIEKGIQPVQYVTPNSLLQKQFTKSFNLYSQALDTEETTKLWDDIADILLEQLRFMKPLYGEMPRNGQIIKNKNFTDEKEWRFVPKIKNNIAPEILFDPIAGLETSEKGIGTHNEAIALIKKARLLFEVSDIKYLLVESEEDAQELSTFIEKLRGNRLNRQDKITLIRKIIVYDDMKGDL